VSSKIRLLATKNKERLASSAPGGRGGNWLYYAGSDEMNDFPMTFITTFILKWAALIAAVFFTFLCTVQTNGTSQLTVIAAGLFVSTAMLHAQECRAKRDRKE
jgi:hypothetical protein